MSIKRITYNIWSDPSWNLLNEPFGKGVVKVDIDEARVSALIFELVKILSCLFVKIWYYR